MELVIELLSTFLTIYLLCVFAWVLLSWLPMISPQLAHHPIVGTVRGFLDSVVLPWVRLFRFVPPVNLGGTLLDLSALVAILTLSFGGRILIGLLATAFGV